MLSSVFNTAAALPGSSNPANHYHHQHQLLRVSSAYSHVSSNHPHRTNRDAKQHDIDHHVVPIESTTNLFITALGNTTMNNKPAGSVITRATKKKCDKRSKIKTSQGLRDRRVRLSIDIARKFFDLQDLLGFDKPSTTVEWLLNKSNKAILDLSPGVSSSTTSSEEAAGTEDCIKSLSSSRSTATCSTNNQIQQVVLLSSDDSLKPIMKQKEAMVIREARERARARARARTLAKLNHQEAVRLLNCHNFSTPSLSKTPSYAERREEKGEEEEEKLRQKHLHTHCYVPNSNLLLDWDISSVIPLPSSSSATNTLNLSTDVEIYTRFSSWDQLSLHNYRTL